MGRKRGSEVPRGNLRRITTYGKAAAPRRPNPTRGNSAAAAPSVERDRAYWKEYARRKCYATVKVDASRAAIGDLSVFCNLLFPFNPRRARVAEALLREMSRLRARKIELSKVAAEICRRERCSARTLAQAWLSLLNSGLLRRSRRNEPAQLSEVFADRLEAIARYWREMVREIPRGELAR